MKYTDGKKSYPSYRVYARVHTNKWYHPEHLGLCQRLISPFMRMIPRERLNMHYLDKAHEVLELSDDSDLVSITLEYTHPKYRPK
ncbi:hypothetical protein GOV09_04730 [Candidatus Woesearchaeota archaeon]|nr:hypothetical protein [Candidatus Woesearchaeota archaeon]